MIRELEKRPESGFLGHIMGLGVIVQYWRSFDQLKAYVRDQDELHWPAWVDFNKQSAAVEGTWASDMKHIGCGRASTSAFTAGCPRWV